MADPMATHDSTTVFKIETGSGNGHTTYITVHGVVFPSFELGAKMELSFRVLRTLERDFKKLVKSQPLDKERK